jgi:acylphosphatase
VQGVGFRAAARRRGEELALDGYARNLPDGRVEIRAEGAAERIEAFLSWCGEGPPTASVTSVAVNDESPEGGATGFSIGWGRGRV